MESKGLVSVSICVNKTQSLKCSRANTKRSGQMSEVNIFLNSQVLALGLFWFWFFPFFIH